MSSVFILFFFIFIASIYFFILLFPCYFTSSCLPCLSSSLFFSVSLFLSLFRQLWVLVTLITLEREREREREKEREKRMNVEERGGEEGWRGNKEKEVRGRLFGRRGEEDKGTRRYSSLLSIQHLLSLSPPIYLPVSSFLLIFFPFLSYCVSSFLYIPTCLPSSPFSYSVFLLSFPLSFFPFIFPSLKHKREEVNII